MVMSHDTRIKNNLSFRDAWLAQSIDHVIFDIGIMSSSPMMGVKFIKKKKFFKCFKKIILNF